MPHWKVRVVFNSGLIHLASSTEPAAIIESGKLTGLTWTPLQDIGDTLMFIDWTKVQALSFRKDNNS